MHPAHQSTWQCIEDDGDGWLRDVGSDSVLVSMLSSRKLQALIRDIDSTPISAREQRLQAVIAANDDEFQPFMQHLLDRITATDPMAASSSSSS